MYEEEGLVKIHIDLPNHWAIGAEALWAEPLGNDLYKLENIPFYAYGLNFQDLVRATPDSEGFITEVREFIKSNGHRTLRMVFMEEIELDVQEELFDLLRAYGGSFERANNQLVAINIKPGGNYLAVYDELEMRSKTGILDFETCEPRIEGSFDDTPEAEK